MFSVTQHQCRHRQMCGKWSQIQPIHSLLSSPKYYLCWLNNLFMWRFQINSIFSYVKNKLQMCSITQHQCRRRQMCGKCSQIPSVHSLLSVPKNDVSWLNNLFMASFELNRMSSYAKNKLQMCSVTHIQSSRRHMCEKCLHINSLLTFGLLQEMTCLHWTIYSCQGFNWLRCPLMLKTNYRFLQSLNISVDVAICVENVHKFSQYTHFCPLQKTTCPDWKIHSWQGSNSLVCPLMPRTNYGFLQSLNIIVDDTKCVENIHQFT